MMEFTYWYNSTFVKQLPSIIRINALVIIAFVILRYYFSTKIKKYVFWLKFTNSFDIMTSTTKNSKPKIVFRNDVICYTFDLILSDLDHRFQVIKIFLRHY